VLRPVTRCALFALLAAAVSCGDMQSAARLFGPRAARKDIDVSVAVVALDLLYNGQSIGPSFGPPTVGALQGDRCFSVTFDGLPRTSACGATTINDLPPGNHTIGLQQTIPGGPPPGTVEDVQPPVAVNLVGGQSTPVTFDISAVRGEVTGTARINGQVPQDGQYQICIDGSGCGMLIGGGFALLVRPGSGTLHLQSMMTLARLADATYTAVAGQTTDIGVIDVQLATLSVDLQYGGQTIGPSFGPPTAGSLQGDRCFNLSVDGAPGASVCGSTLLANFPPGSHAIGLQQFQSGGPPPGTYVDVVAPTPITLTGGQTTPVVFDITPVRGKIVGTVQVNGSPAPDGQYQICIDGSGCGMLAGGSYALLARPGSGSVKLESMMSLAVISTIPFTVVAGQTTDLGALNVQLASLAVDLLYNGQSIGPAFGPPLAGTAQGDKCFNVTVDGQSSASVCGATTVPNLPPGQHTIGLQQFTAGGPPPGGTYTDVQTPVTVTLVGGQSTPVAFDISTLRGKISGVVHINGQAPPDGQYQVCLGTGGGCGQIFGGQFTLFTRPGSGTGTLQNMMQLTTLANFSYIVAAGKTTLIGGVSTAAPGSTPTGTGVSVQPVNQTDGTSNATVGLTFADVSTTGTTTVVQSTTGPAVPAGLQLGSPPVFFDISTTATFDGSVDVCINYTGTTFTDPSQARLLHGDGAGNWVDVTTTHDQVNRIICGSVTSFSPFVVAQRIAAPAQKPTVAASLSAQPNATGWYTSNVTVSWIVNDNGTPITSETGCGTITVSTNTAGTTFGCSATSPGGTASASVTLKRDASAPSVVPVLSGTVGANGWYTSDVGVSATISAGGPSGASGTCSPTTVSVDAASVPYICTATSGAGLSATASGTIKRDATNPVVGFTGAQSSYTVDQTVAIVCSATDATSGLAASQCPTVNAPAYSFLLGNNVLSAHVADAAGNSASAQVQFTVSVTGPSFGALITRFLAAGKAQKQLQDRLANILDKEAKGNSQAMSEQIKNFLKELADAQSGGAVSAANAAVLSTLVQKL
jgi:carbon monoxide dehydrogenase subunit G